MKMYSGLYSSQHPYSPCEDMPPPAQGRLRQGRGGAANGGRCAPPAGPGEAEPCAMAASRLPPSTLTLRQDAIRMMITQGHMQLRELQKALKLAKS
eukprot:XP_025004525.1 LYR motif-containing protein 2 isoform X1 [Gallus gallus]